MSFEDLPPGGAAAPAAPPLPARMGRGGQGPEEWHWYPLFHQGSLRAGSEPVPNRKPVL